MGNKQNGQNNQFTINKNQFEFVKIIGKGGFGKVYKVLSKKYNKIYAMKEMSKLSIIEQKSEKNVKNERELLTRINHPFIINMYFSFQDKENLYLSTEFLEGKDLRYYIIKKIKFTENQVKFLIACLILSLEYLHSNYIIHRDIKPENLIFDSKGYLKLTDFGIAIIQEPNLKDSSGTPGYSAPEIIYGHNQTIVSDYFSLGILCYEFMKGVRPYNGKSREEIKEKIMSKQIQIKKFDICNNWSLDSADFINKCIQRKPSLRLGYKGISELKEHKWLKGFNWRKLYNFQIQSPFIPNLNDNYDDKYFSFNETTDKKYIKVVNWEKINLTFLDYYEFDREDVLKKGDHVFFVNIHEEMYNNNDENDI